MGPKGRIASPALARLLVDRHPGLCVAAIYALRDLGVTLEAIPALIEALNFCDPETREFQNRYCGYFFGASTDLHAEVANHLSNFTNENHVVDALEKLARTSTKEEDEKKWRRIMKRYDVERERLMHIGGFSLKF
ncbi:MAG: hypothetical protein G01um1014106_14 [Parcubacteria group bacterium Gr01-1014_106]|nr:MAG: hypothetical protein G01um1014106_14 [Parcubacteria group bacterium Gr01-1014_106]